MSRPKSATRKLKDYSASRKLYGAYNDPRLKEDSNFASKYTQEHTDVVTRQAVREMYISQAEKAKAKMDSELNMSDEDFFKMMGMFEKSQEAFTPKILDFKQAYPAMGGVVSSVEAIRNGKVNQQDISKAIGDFELVMYRLMNAISLGAGFSGIDFSKIKTKDDLSPAEIERVLQGKANVHAWLKNDAGGAAKALKNLFDNYDSFVDAYKKGEENSAVWKTSTSVQRMDEKSAGSIYGSTLKALQSVQGGIGEKVMAAEIAKQMQQIDEVLAKGVSVTGSKSTGGKFAKGDISVPYKKSDGTIIDAKVSAKAKQLNMNSKTKISIEGGGKDTQTYFTKYGLGHLYEPYSVLSHFKNINGKLSSINSTLYSISSLVGAEHALEAFGVHQNTHFLSFTNKIIPTYKLLQQMGQGGYELHIGSNDEKFMKYTGKYTQKDAYREYLDFKGGSQPSWSSYQKYIQQKSNTIKRTQFVLGYRK